MFLKLENNEELMGKTFSNLKTSYIVLVYTTFYANFMPRGTMGDEGIDHNSKFAVLGIKDILK
jgi:hypothetical protein